jgi:hypothetical protein
MEEPAEQMLYLGVRVPKRTHDAIVRIQKASPIHVSLTAVVQHLLQEAIENKENSKRRRK